MSTQPSIFSHLRADDEGTKWQEFYDRYAPVVYRVAVAHGLSEADARDTVQEVLMRFVKNVDRFRYDRQRGKFRSYLYTMTMNVVRTQLVALSKTAHSIASPESVMVDDSWALWEREWQANQLRQAIDAVAAGMAPKTFQAFQLVVLEEWPADKVAKFLNISRAAVYQAKSRMIKRLRAYLERVTEDDD